MLNPKSLFVVIGAAAAAVLPVGIHDAHATLTCTATVCTSFIDTVNTQVVGPAPYAVMTLTLTSATTAHVEFDSINNGSLLYLMGGMTAAAVNVNAATFTVANITGNNTLGETGFTAGPFSDGGAATLNGFGSFNQTITDFDGFAHAVDKITFDLTDTSGIWSSASVVLAANGSGFFDGIHVFPCAVTGGDPTTCLQSNGVATTTGFAVEGGPIITTSGPPLVPEPSALGLLGTALGALGLIGWRRRKSA